MRLRPLAAALLLSAAVLSGCDQLEGGGAGEPEPEPGTWEEQAAAIDGIVDYRTENPEILTQDHTEEPVDYPVLPPVGGNHSQVWLNCNGEVYQQVVPNENAVHSLEHGSVWITYRPDLPAEEVSELAERVQGLEKMFMSPFPDLDAPISLQAWGYQLKVDDAGDERIDEFIRALRVNASPEGPAAPCDGGLSG